MWRAYFYNTRVLTPTNVTQDHIFDVCTTVHYPRIFFCSIGHEWTRIFSFRWKAFVSLSLSLSLSLPALFAILSLSCFCFSTQAAAESEFFRGTFKRLIPLPIGNFYVFHTRRIGMYRFQAFSNRNFAKNSVNFCLAEPDEPFYLFNARDPAYYELQLNQVVNEI